MFSDVRRTKWSSLRRLLCLPAACLALLAGEEPAAPESWRAVLATMPLRTNVTELNWTNCAKLILAAYQSNEVVRALILMPGATDELYFFHRVKVTLTNATPTLLDVVVALTNQSYIRVAYRPPMLLLHSREDLLDASFKINHEPTSRFLRQTPYLPVVRYNDRDWDYLLPHLTGTLEVNFLPSLDSPDSYHFYRHSFAACHLTGWETLVAISLAGRSVFTVDEDRVRFEVDYRPREAPIPPSGPVR
jgi:hypothetical protein